MTKLATFLLWLVALLTKWEIRIVVDDEGDVDDAECDEMLTIDWLEYCYAISDGCPKGDCTTEQDPS